MLKFTVIEVALIKINRTEDIRGDEVKVKYCNSALQVTFQIESDNQRLFNRFRNEELEGGQLTIKVPAEEVEKYLVGNTFLLAGVDNT